MSMNFEECSKWGKCIFGHSTISYGSHPMCYQISLIIFKILISLNIGEIIEYSWIVISSKTSILYLYNYKIQFSWEIKASAAEIFVFLNKNSNSLKGC